MDRDGIINIDYSYTYKIDEFKFVPYIFELVNIFALAGYKIIVVTNQSGIGRGYYTEDDFDILSEWMVGEFAKKDITISKVLHCPHLPLDNCNCRKPNIGMIEQALTIFDIDLGSSWMIGDKQSDIDLARNASIGTSIAIGDDNIKNASLSFDTIEKMVQYLQLNKGIL